MTSEDEIVAFFFFSLDFFSFGVVGERTLTWLWDQGVSRSKGCSVSALKDESLLSKGSTLSGLSTFVGFISCSAGFGLWKLVQDGPRQKRDGVNLSPCTAMHFAVREAGKLPALNVYLYI